MGELSVYGEAALGAARWLDSVSIEVDRVRRWPVVADDSSTWGCRSLYGEAGVAWFLAEAAGEFGEPELRHAAADAARACLHPDGTDEGFYGLYTGRAGSVLVASHTALMLGDGDQLRVVHSALDELLLAAIPAEVGVHWPAHPDGRGPWNELYHGNAGIGLALRQLAQQLHRLDALDAARSAADRLLVLAVEAPAGLWWRSRPDDLKPAPNIAHGTTGVALFLSEIGLVLGDARYLDAAGAGASYLLSIARTDDGGCAVHHHFGGGEDEYTLGWCSGPPGLGCLFVSLFRATGDREWLGWAERAAQTVMASGVPQRLYPGFWDNVGQCCGRCTQGSGTTSGSAADQRESWTSSSACTR